VGERWDIQESVWDIQGTSCEYPAEFAAEAVWIKTFQFFQDGANWYREAVAELLRLGPDHQYFSRRRGIGLVLRRADSVDRSDFGRSDRPFESRCAFEPVHS
jgi:hypothetical protein